MKRSFILKSQRGISLVEILITIAILGVLAAVLFPTAVRMTKSAAQASDAATLRNLGSASEQFSQDHNNHLIVGLDRHNFFGKNLREGKPMSWIWLLEPYLEEYGEIRISPDPERSRQNPALISPADPSRGGAERLGPNKVHRSYAINRRTEWGDGKWGKSGKSVNKLVIARPSIFVIMGNYDINAAGDSANINSNVGSGNNNFHLLPDWFGNGTVNLYFLDGHIENVKVEDLMPGGKRDYLFDRELNRQSNLDQPNSGFF